MYTSAFNTIKPSAKRWIYVYLYLLDQFSKSTFSDLIKIESVSLDLLTNASYDIKCKKQALLLVEKLRNKKKITLTEANRFLHLVFSSQNEHISKRKYVTQKYKLHTVLDAEFTNGLVSDEERVSSAFNTGIKLIRQVSTSWSNRINNVIDVVAGIEDDYNIINSGFTKDFPGFISFNINSSPSVIGEQLVHESTHLMFDNILFFNKQIRKFILDLPPVFSIFAQKPRTAELVIHGLFSYTSVYLFWDSLEKNKLGDYQLAKKRKQYVLKYIQNAIVNLNNILSEQEWVKLRNIYKSISPLSVNLIWQVPTKRKLSGSQFITNGSKYFNEIELAEILLASKGNKVSRVSKPVKALSPIIQLLNLFNINYCFSSYLFQSTNDNNIRNFSNVITAIHNLDSHVNELSMDIHIYFSAKKIDLKKAFILDQQDACGDLFKIPKCCQKYFIENWNDAVQNYGGDLVRQLNKDQAIIINGKQALYSPTGMYFGKGLCWHFKCSDNCAATRMLIQSRIKSLSSHKSFLKKLLPKSNVQISYSKKDGYKMI